MRSSGRERVLTVVGRGRGRERGCTHNLECHIRQTVDIVSLRSRGGAHRVFAGPDTKREEGRGGAGGCIAHENNAIRPR